MSCRGGRPCSLPSAIRSLRIYRPSPANPNKTRVDFLKIIFLGWHPYGSEQKGREATDRTMSVGPATDG
jgi:hypothetical protein